MTRRKKTIKQKDLKVQKRCENCGNELPKYSKHHKYCHKCWKERQLEKGNLALIGGVK